ncbi:serine/threonine-protein kinase Sgk2 [Nemania sp. FL0031]|nr:serine/threonine-protein kinase Sgk2 [Nemania sp. FL0031]
MPLTGQQMKIISERPLNDAFDHLRDQFRDFNETDDLLQEHIRAVLVALVLSPAALSLPSPLGSSNVATNLLSIKLHLQDNVVNLDPFRPLLRHVVEKAPDETIWAAVFSLIDAIRPRTPPLPSIVPTFKGTPIKTSSSRLADSETRDIVELELFEEIKNCTFRNVGGFCDKFFNPQNWREEQKTMLKGIMTTYDGKVWKDFPATPDEGPVWDWLRSLEERFLAEAPYKLHTTATAHQFKERKGQMDIFLQQPATSSIFQYKHVLVVGEQKKSYSTSRFKADLLQLTRYVRGVFADQPTRRFVHAFSFCASKMELWIFDRSGAYSSGPFDIHHEPDKFARALVGYTTMDDVMMGLDTFIEREDNHRYITLSDVNNNETRIKLNQAMVRQKAIVCRGTTCYKTENNHVAKFSWASDKRKPEVEHLKLAEERGVKGVARVVAHRRITTVAEMREGLQFPKAHWFRRDDIHFEDLPSATTSTSALGHKRKSSSDITSDSGSGSKRPRSNSQRSKLVRKLDDQPSIASEAKPSLYTPGEDLWDDRIYSCLVISPAGRVISEFSTAKELLESLQDAIKAHQSLYTTGNILHRDISSNNIIITDPTTTTTDGFRGMLIDLDLAKVRDSGPSGARHQTGTMQFMAIEVLRKADHTYRHDLESFFYVLLWVCARQAWSNGFSGENEKALKKSTLRRWEIGSFEEIANNKEGDMTVNGLERIMREFPQSLDIIKPLCLRIRNVLFPFDKDLRMSFGTPAGDPGQLYAPIIEAYDEAISSL